MLKLRAPLDRPCDYSKNVLVDQETLLRPEPLTFLPCPLITHDLGSSRSVIFAYGGTPKEFAPWFRLTHRSPRFSTLSQLTFQTLRLLPLVTCSCQSRLDPDGSKTLLPVDVLIAQYPFVSLNMARENLGKLST